jgi:hypothetical protein
MNLNYQQMEYQALIDLLAEETQVYTRAFINKNQQEITNRGIGMAMLIAEIKARQREGSLPATNQSIPPNDYFEAAT